MMLRLAVLGILFTICFAEDEHNIGSDKYIPCKYCRIAKNQYPDEGRMACFRVRRVNRFVPGREVMECRTVCVPDGFGGCNHEEKCTTRKANVSIPDCELVSRTPDKEISQRTEEFGTIFQINSPNYFGYRKYPHSMFCVWNVANEGLVTYRIVDQSLQNATDCEDEACKCPDHMNIIMGGNEMTLCGSRRPDISNQMSSDGLHVKFCSDNAVNSRGILVMAYRHKGNEVATNPPEVPTLDPLDDGDSKKKRQATETCENRMEAMSTEMSRMGCQYEYMMRMSQPGSPCPNDSIIMSLVNYHDYMMTGFDQTMDMCDGSHEVMTMDMPMMNNIESCAVDYLYRSRDCEFAKRVVNAANGELSDVAHMIVGNNFPIRVPKWMNMSHTKCS